MATYKAISAGDATTLAIWQVWNGSAWVGASVLPSSADDVYTNSFIVTVTTSISYASWSNAENAAPVIARGGSFRITGANDITTQGIVSGMDFGTTPTIERLATHTGKYTHIGDHIGGNGNFAYALRLLSIFDCDIYGNSIGKRAGASGLVVSANCNLRIFGNQTGGSFSNTIHTPGVLINSACNVQVFGNQLGGTSAQSYGLQITVAGVTCRITGIAEASLLATAVHNSSATSYVIYEGSAFNNLGMQAIISPLLYFKVIPTSVWRFNDFDGNEQIFVSPNSVVGMPPEDKVKSGYEYGTGLTGTLEAEEFLALPIALKERLERVATTEEVGTIWAD
jgi:hypothetical protein